MLEQFHTVSKQVRFQTTHLAVFMGLGSKFPCASTAACFSTVAPKLASTKSGGRAPAMAQRHELAILKSSASYFCRGEDMHGLHCGLPTTLQMQSLRAELLDGQMGAGQSPGMKKKGRELKKSAESGGLSQTDE